MPPSADEVSDDAADGEEWAEWNGLPPGFYSFARKDTKRRDQEAGERDQGRGHGLPAECQPEQESELRVPDAKATLEDDGEKKEEASENAGRGQMRQETTRIRRRDNEPDGKHRREDDVIRKQLVFEVDCREQHQDGAEDRTEQGVPCKAEDDEACDDQGEADRSDR